ncbi:MAG: cation diffusion facilitator family transporter [Saprospiraceae bacterium]|nr:cation diffusion facilitator family transporter [Saprospiraceae bacterium]
MPKTNLVAKDATREHQIIRASWLSILVNALLSVLKIVVGLTAGSLAVVADGIDSASDIVTSLITLITARIISKPPNIRHVYGYEKADTVASKLLAFVIFFAGAQLTISTVQRLLENETRELPSIIAVVVVLISIVGKQLLAFYLNKVGKKIDSSMLRANGRNMQNDVVISISVLLGLIFTHLFNMPVLDAITALIVSIWIMIVAVKIIIKTSRELMDGVEDPGVYKTITEAVKQVNEAGNPHRIRVRKMAHYYIVALDIEIDGQLSLDEAHRISHQVEDNIKRKLPNVYDVLIHLEPVGNDNDNEVFGISGKDL